MSNSSWPHGLQHARLPCPSLSPEVCSNSCPLSWRCYPTIPSSAAPFSCPQSFTAPGYFSMSHLFTLGSQRIRASASVLPMNIQGWFALGLIGLISLLSEGLSSLLQHHNSKASILQHSTFFMVQLLHLYTITGKTTVMTIATFVGKVMSQLFLYTV